VTDYTLAQLTQPSGPKPSGRGLLVVLVLVGVAAVGGTGVAVALALTSHSTKGSASAAASPTASWHSVFGDNTAAPTTPAATAPVNLGDPAARAACEAVKAAGADGEYDPDAMQHVVDAGTGATDPAIAPSIQALAAKIRPARAAPKEIAPVLEMATAAINLATACIELRYTTP
jgi:hypothetical protein